MNESMEQEQFDMDEAERRTDDFLRCEFEAELAAVRKSRSASFTQMAEISALCLAQSPLRITTADESTSPVTERPAHSSTPTIRSTDRRSRRWTITTAAAAAVIVLGLTIMISINSGNNKGLSNIDNIASSLNTETQSLLPSLGDDALALEINAMERDLDRLQSDLNDSPVGENDSYLATSRLDNDINQFEVDMETF